MSYHMPNLNELGIIVEKNGILGFRFPGLFGQNLEFLAKLGNFLLHIRKFLPKKTGSRKKKHLFPTMLGILSFKVENQKCFYLTKILFQKVELQNLILLLSLKPNIVSYSCARALSHRSKASFLSIQSIQQCL